MRKNPDFTKPTFDNGESKWYLDPHFQEYLQNEQDENLPKLENLACFVVKGKYITDYVLIDNEQNVIDAYSYPEGFEQMEAKINIIKVSKAFDSHEKNNI